MVTGRLSAFKKKVFLSQIYRVLFGLTQKEPNREALLRAHERLKKDTGE